MACEKNSSGIPSASFPVPVSRRCIFIIIIVSLYSFFSVPAHATSWADPGDILLRHDLQLLADSGLLQMPLTTWPVSWWDIRQNMDNITQAHPQAHPDAAVQQALARIRQRLATLSSRGYAAWQTRLTAATDPVMPFRTFAATPRAPGEIEARVAGGNQHIAYRVQAQAVTEPEDGQNLRLDGSYATLLLGNWGVTLGTLERWWGPGWDGSLILSNNARPVPGLTIQRIMSDPLPWQPLTRLGPWQLVFSTGLDSNRADINNALLTTVRLNFKPTTHLEIGLSRVAQWGGEGRSEDMRTFFNMLLGQDNSADASGYFEPGNQLAGYDVRWVSPVFNLPYAIYGQLIGEDEAGNLPYKFIGLTGMEWWGTTAASIGAASYRLHVEYADTAVDFYKSPKFNIAYRHHLYSEGYVYRERFLGHTAGGDARSLSLGGILAYSDSAYWQGLIRWIQTGRANIPAQHASLEVSYTTAVNGSDQYQISTSLVNQEAGTEARASLRWTHAF